MVHSVNLLAVFLLVLFLSIFSSLARADTVNDYVQIQCNRDLNFLQIRFMNVNGQIPREYEKKNPQGLWKKYGMISLDALFKINLDGSFQQPIGFDNSCDLKADEAGKKIEYKIRIKGNAGNANPNQMCGLHRTIILDISDDNEPLVEGLNFAPDCHDTFSISEVTLLPHEGYLTVWGTKDLVERSIARQEVVSLIFWKESQNEQESFPANNKKIYERGF